MHKWLLTAASSILIASVAAGQYKTNPAPVATSTPTIQPVIEQADGARRIPREEAIAMVKSGKAVYIDVRSKDDYDMEHVRGAISYPLNELGRDIQSKKLDRLPKNKFLITYCACVKEHTAAAAVVDLNAQGIENTAALLGGWNEWKSAGLPTDGTVKMASPRKP